jgi:Domain of unknown function (DUF6089)
MMRKLFLLIFYFFIYGFTGAQNIQLNLFTGISNYQGDLQKAKFTFSQSGFAFGAGAAYEITEKFYVRLNFIAGKVRGKDKASQINGRRNLSFSSPITEINLGLEYDLMNVYENRYALYIFAGIGGFKFNPSAIDSLGQKVYLQPLGTEGQGFYMGRKKYALKSLVIPFGGGLKMVVNDDVLVRLEAGIRKTFTDYLDDVSTTYPDPAALLANNGPKALELTFRGDELKPGLVYPITGSIRGGSKRTDYYYTVGVAVSFRINTKSGGAYKYKNKSNLGCPVRVY